jgi:hypothetical protein
VSAQPADEIIEALRARGAIAADAAALPMDSLHRPWFVTLLLGVAGWLAGIFLLVFIGIFLHLDSRPGVGIMGLVLLGGAWVLYQADRQATFLDQLALALSIAGQIAVAWAMLEHVRSALAIAATLLLIQLAVFAIMPNKTARTLAALFAIIAWVFAVRFAIQPGSGDEDFFRVADGHSRSVGVVVFTWLVTWLPLIALCRWLTLRENIWMAQSARAHARPLLTGTLIGISIGGIATEPFMTLALGIDAIGIDVGWLALFPLLSIALAMFAGWCAFQVRSAGLAGFAAFASLLHLSRFYYLYGTSLTWKALIMLCLGAILLGVGVWLQRRLSAGAGS